MAEEPRSSIECSASDSTTAHSDLARPAVCAGGWILIRWSHEDGVALRGGGASRLGPLGLWRRRRRSGADREIGPRSVAELCATEVRCGTFADMASCTSARVSSTAQVEADTASGKTVYDPAAAGICLDALAMLSCSASGSTTQLQACTDAVKGTVADGGPCVAGNQCVSSVCNVTATSCASGMACCAGTCGPRAPSSRRAETARAPARAAPMEPSATPPRRARSARNGRRPARAARWRRNARPGLACVRMTGATTGTCGTYPATGQDCSNARHLRRFPRLLRAGDAPLHEAHRPRRRLRDRADRLRPLCQLRPDDAEVRREERRRRRVRGQLGLPRLSPVHERRVRPAAAPPRLPVGVERDHTPAQPSKSM